MEHLAILKSEFLEKIANGEKTIESRWYKSKKKPYGSIYSGDKIYLKASGKKVNLKADIKKVLTFEDLNEEKIKEIIKEFGKEICIDYNYLEKIKEKKIGILIFLDNVEKIEPFNINKKGFGNMAAWICVDNIESIKQ